MNQTKLLSLLAAMMLSVTTATATDVASVTTSADVTTNYASFSDALSAWDNGCTLKLLAAVEISSTIPVTSGSKTLDLNGYGIKMTGNMSIFRIKGNATLTIEDSRPDTPHRYTLSENTFSFAGLAALNEASGTITVNGGYLTGGAAQYSNGEIQDRGGAIFVNGGNVVMNGGNIIGNKGRWGGAIFLKSGRFTLNDGASIQYNFNHTSGSGAVCFVEGATFIMNGGLIKGNYGQNNCGGIKLAKNGAMEMTGGAIEYNAARNGAGAIGVETGSSSLVISGGTIQYNRTNGSGGAIALENTTNSYMEISGGTIQYNHAAGNGGGIYCGKPLRMRGNPVITDNTCAGSGADLYLNSGKIITVTGAMTDGADVHITMATPGSFTSGYSTYNSVSPAEYFTINDGNYVPTLNASGEVRCAAIQNLAAGQDPQNDGEYYSTFFDSSQKFLLEDGVEAYVGELRSSLLHLTRIAVGGQVIPANTAVILKADHQPVVLTPTDASPVSVESNDLQGADYTLSAPANCYVLSSHSADYTINEIGFYQFTGTLGAHKAYLIISAGSGAPSRLRFVFSEENAATGMEAISNQQSAISSQKQIENGQLIIIRDGIRYNAQGMIVK